MFWLIGSAFALINFRPTATSNGSALCGHISRFTGFGGSGGKRNFAAPFGAQNWPKTPNGGFSRSWGPFWAKHPPTKFDHTLNADPVNPMWTPMSPLGPEILGFEAGLGARTCCTFDGLASCGRNSQFTGFLGVWGNFAAARGPKRAKSTEKVDVPGLGGRSG